jgi:hypothetical protein
MLVLFPMQYVMKKHSLEVSRPERIAHRSPPLGMKEKCVELIAIPHTTRARPV